MSFAPIPSLGRSTVSSPLHGTPRASFVREDAHVLFDVDVPGRRMPEEPFGFERAGPRESIFFEPSKTAVGIVSAGGICPGINDVIRAIVMALHHGYGVGRILGFRFGFAGLDAASRHEPILLEPSTVRDVHSRAGTMLGTARGPTPPSRMVDTLARLAIDVLLVIGGDGTMRAAHAIHREVKARDLPIGVVAIPKTIDNDLPFVDKTFGFETAVTTSRLAIDAAHAEARSVSNGVGVVKLMGRTAGFIAATATLASHDVNACLVPEVPLQLEGQRGFLSWLEARVVRRGHAVVVVAEGCASVLAHAPAARDASGNEQFTSGAHDAGRILKQAIEAHFAARQVSLTLKYIDPSYMVRATLASADDAVFCGALARSAVHAAMAGKTDLMVGRWHRCFTHVPLETVLAHQKRLDPSGDLWREVLETTGQPAFG